MSRPLWEICRKQEDFRRLWDSLPRPGRVRELVHRVRRLPWRRYVLFLRAVLRYVLHGLPRASREQVHARRSVCDPCFWRDKEKDQCTQCGCHLGGKADLIAKLTWATEKCPLYNPVKRPGEYWGPVKGETVFRRLWHRVYDGLVKLWTVE